MNVVLLSGGTGGAKLARGLLDEADALLITYWLADEIDERGYGLRGDSWHVMDALAAAGRPTWFRLGDRDLAMCMIRTEALRAGARLTEAHALVVDAMGVAARVLPMADEPVATHVRHDGRTLPFQEYMIVERAAPPVEGVSFEGIERARPTAEVLAAVREAQLIVIGPSNPVISIGPILALPGTRDALVSAAAPVVAVSPFVGGRSVKGPSEHFCVWAGIELSATGVAAAYAGLLDGIVADEPVDGLPCVVTDTLMDSTERMRQVARKIVEFGASLAG